MQVSACHSRYVQGVDHARALRMAEWATQDVRLRYGYVWRE